MKLFLDTRFIDTGKELDLISIGITSDTGYLYYACNRDVQLNRVSPESQRSILDSLPSQHYGTNPMRLAEDDPVKADIETWRYRHQIANDLRLLGRSQPEIWSYNNPHGWVALCQLFGRVEDLPNGFPATCHDIQSLATAMGKHDYLTEHPCDTPWHSLANAVWIKRMHQILTKP